MVPEVKAVVETGMPDESDTFGLAVYPGLPAVTLLFLVPVPPAVPIVNVSVSAVGFQVMVEPVKVTVPPLPT